MSEGTNQTLAGGGLHHVALRATDFERTLRFYCEGLGFARKMAWTMGKGRKAAMLDAGDGNYLEVFSDGDPEDPAEARLAHFCLRTGDCQSAFDRAIAAGAGERLAPKTVEIDDEVTGGKVELTLAFVKGPDGEVIEFIQSEAL